MLTLSVVWCWAGSVHLVFRDFSLITTSAAAGNEANENIESELQQYS